MTASCALIILFTRFPEPGRCKTRLIPALGATGAADLQQQMTEQVLHACLSLDPAHRTIEVHYEGGDRSAMQDWLGQDLCFHPQSPGDIGQRMAQALCPRLEESPVLLLGSDCPTITAPILEQAISALKGHDLVLGPSHDGGYYLIGAGAPLDKTSRTALFNNIPWGRDTVLSSTISRLDELGLSYHLLPTLHDIDTPDDLQHLHHLPDPQ